MTCVSRGGAMTIIRGDQARSWWPPGRMTTEPPAQWRPPNPPFLRCRPMENHVLRVPLCSCWRNSQMCDIENQSSSDGWDPGLGPQSDTVVSGRQPGFPGQGLSLRAGFVHPNDSVTAERSPTHTGWVCTEMAEGLEQPLSGKKQEHAQAAKPREGRESVITPLPSAWECMSPKPRTPVRSISTLLRKCHLYDVISSS